MTPATVTMSDILKLNLAKTGLLVAILAGLAGLLGAWVVLPYRMSAAEATLSQLSHETRVDHEALTRVDERTARMERVLDRIERK